MPRAANPAQFASPSGPRSQPSAPPPVAPARAGSEPIARYVRIASILKGRIVRGDWPRGTLVPGVDQLAETYGVARATARQALQSLVAEGLIVSERGRGSSVVYVPPRRAELDGNLLFVLTPPPPGHRITVLERRHGVSLNTALFQPGKAAPAYTLIRKVHSQDGEPFGYFEVFIASDLYARLPRGADNHQKLALLLVAEGVAMGRGQDVLTIESADWDEAGYLGVSMASPIARIVRTRVDRARRIVYAANNIYRGDRFKQTRGVANYHYQTEGDLQPDQRGHGHPPR